MDELDKKIFIDVLDIIDEGLGIEHGIITNRFATATNIISYLIGEKKKLLVDYQMNNMFGQKSEENKKLVEDIVDSYLIKNK